MPSSRPVNEEIAMTGANSKEQVQDIKAINAVKQRTIVYDGVQKAMESMRATLWISG
jgi:hypothetical protein